VPSVCYCSWWNLPGMIGVGLYGGGDGRRVGHKRKLTGEVLTQGKARCAGRTSLRGICVDGASGQLFSAAGNGKTTQLRSGGLCRNVDNLSIIAAASTIYKKDCFSHTTNVGRDQCSFGIPFRHLIAASASYIEGGYCWCLRSAIQ
jgi:hypothetical protein